MHFGVGNLNPKESKKIRRGRISSIFVCCILAGCSDVKVCDEEFILVLSADNTANFNGRPVGVESLGAEFSMAADSCDGKIMLTLTVDPKVANGFAIEIMDAANASADVHGVKFFMEKQSGS